MAAIMRFLAIAVLLTASIAAAADAVKGKELFRGCAGCHSYDGEERKSAPSLRTLFGKVMLRNGTRTSEENVRLLILDGFNRMPSYRYQFRPDEFDDLIAFLKTLNAKPAVETKASGKDLFAAYCARCHGANSKMDLAGLFQREKLSNGKPVTERNVRILIDDGHADLSAMKNWLDETAIKALLAYVKTL